MKIFGDPINFQLLEKQNDRIEKIITSLLQVMNEELPHINADIKEIRTFVRNLFYEITYVYYYIKSNLKPDDQSKIKKLVDLKLQDLIGK